MDAEHQNYEPCETTLKLPPEQTVTPISTQMGEF